MTIVDLFCYLLAFLVLLVMCIHAVWQRPAKSLREYLLEARGSDMEPKDWKEKVLNYLHEKAGICSHCGKKECAGKQSFSTLPAVISTEIVLAAITKATA